MSEDQGSRPERFVSLLGDTDDAAPGRPVRGPLPAQGSDHSRFDQMQAPSEDFDLGRAQKVCGEISRHLLMDLAPALMLLPAAERMRVRALLAWTRTLLDFANDPGLEGERLAQINRWQFALEQSLDGQPPGQPIFVLLAATEQERPWPRSAFDELAAIARMRISVGSKRGSGTTKQDQVRLIRAGAQALFGDLDPPLEESLVAVVRAHSLLAEGGPERPEEAIREESRSIQSTLAEGPSLAALPPSFRPVADFLVGAALELAKARESSAAAGRSLLGPWTRAKLLVRAKLRNRA